MLVRGQLKDGNIWHFLNNLFYANVGYYLNNYGTLN